MEFTVLNLVLIFLGLWAIGFGVFVDFEKWALGRQLPP